MLEAFIKEKGQQLPAPAHLGPADWLGTEEAGDDAAEEVSTTMLHLHVSHLSRPQSLMVRWARQASKFTFMGRPVPLPIHHEIHQ